MAAVGFLGGDEGLRCTDGGGVARGVGGNACEAELKNRDSAGIRRSHPRTTSAEGMVELGVSLRMPM